MAAKKKPAFKPVPSKPGQDSGNGPGFFGGKQAAPFGGKKGGAKKKSKGK